MPAERKQDTASTQRTCPDNADEWDLMIQGIVVSTHPITQIDFAKADSEQTEAEG